MEHWKSQTSNARLRNAQKRFKLAAASRAHAAQQLAANGLDIARYYSAVIMGDDDGTRVFNFSNITPRMLSADPDDQRRIATFSAIHQDFLLSAWGVVDAAAEAGNFPREQSAKMLRGLLVAFGCTPDNWTADDVTFLNSI